jgi:hypothetical protein
MVWHRHAGQTKDINQQAQWLGYLYTAWPDTTLTKTHSCMAYVLHSKLVMMHLTGKRCVSCRQKPNTSGPETHKCRTCDAH